MLPFSAQILLIRSKPPFLRWSAALVCRELEDVRLGHHVGVEGARAEAEVDHAGLHRLADLEGRDRFRPADEVDLKDALAVLVDVGDPVEACASRRTGSRESADQAQRDFLRAGDRRN